MGRAGMAFLLAAASVAAADVVNPLDAFESAEAVAVHASDGVLALKETEAFSDWRVPISEAPVIRVKVERSAATGEVVRLKTEPAKPSEAPAPASQPSGPKTEPLPEPATLALLGIGGAFILVTRRRRT